MSLTFSLSLFPLPLDNEMLAPASLLSSFWVHNLDYFISVSSKLNEISIWAESNLLGSGPICHHISPGVCSITALFLSNQIRPQHLTCSGEKGIEGERDRKRKGYGEWLTLVCVHHIKLFGFNKLTRKRSVVRVTIFFCSDNLGDKFMKSI